MKFLCANCGKRFDVELCGEMCPYCGRVNTMSGQSPAPAAQAMYEEIDNDRYSMPEYSENFTWQRERIRWRVVLIPAAIALAMFVALAVLVGISVWQDTQKPQPQLTDTQPLPITTTMQMQNEAFAYGTHGRKVTVGTAQVIDDCPWVQDGTVFVRVWLQVGKATEAEYRTDVNFYLSINDEYYQQASSYRLTDGGIVEEVELLDAYSMYTSGMDEGWVYFVVPQGAASLTLWIETLSINSDTYAAESSEMIGIELTLEGIE